jgi:hypothetical protein
VIDNVVWTDSWSSIAGAGCGLICVGAGEERVRKVLACVASDSGETSRLGSMDPVAERDQVRVVWWQAKEDEVRYGFLVEPQNQGRVRTTWRPSHEWDWCGGCTKTAGFKAVHHKTVRVPWLCHKAKTGGSTDRDGIGARRETSKRRTRVGIARFASR